MRHSWVAYRRQAQARNIGVGAAAITPDTKNTETDRRAFVKAKDCNIARLKVCGGFLDSLEFPGLWLWTERLSAKLFQVLLPLVYLRDPGPFPPSKVNTRAPHLYCP